MYYYLLKVQSFLKKKYEGLEMIEVAILIAVVVLLGLIFKKQLTAFINKVFDNLLNSDF